MWAKALVLVNPTVLEVILQDLFASAELLRFPYYGLDPSLRRPRGFRRCRAPSWLHYFVGEHRQRKVQQVALFFEFPSNLTH